MKKMYSGALVALAAVVAGCAAPAQGAREGPALSFPMHLGQGDGDDDRAATNQKAGDSERVSPQQTVDPSETEPVDEAAERRAKYGSLPDPPPLSTTSQWEMTFDYDKGSLSLSSVKHREFAAPISTARRMGRFAVELWIGHELIDRVRFDFPLVTSQVQDRREGHSSEPVRLDRDATSTQTLLVPDSQRATRAVLVDRASGQETPLVWPPHRPHGPGSADVPKTR